MAVVADNSTELVVSQLVLLHRISGIVSSDMPLEDAQIDVLVSAIKEVLQEAVKAGGSSLRDHRQTNGELGYFQKVFAAYDREGEPCIRRDCHGRIKRVVQCGRSTFYCPACQAY